MDEDAVIILTRYCQDVIEDMGEELLQARDNKDLTREAQLLDQLADIGIADVQRLH